jgi:hypothetical protein
MILLFFIDVSKLESNEEEIEDKRLEDQAPIFHTPPINSITINRELILELQKRQSDLLSFSENLEVFNHK